MFPSNEQPEGQTVKKSRFKQSQEKTVKHNTDFDPEEEIDSKYKFSNEETSFFFH